MPSRSPEPPSGATRDEAIAAARAEFGTDVRIRGVRRVRTGGVAGFFSSERYVADVVDSAGGTAPAPAAPSGPTPATPAPAALTPADALAQWPAAGLSVDDLLAVAQEVSRAQRSAGSTTSTGTPVGRPVVDPVAELDDLFSAGPADVDVYSPTSLARPPAPRAVTPAVEPRRAAAPQPLTQRRAEQPAGPSAPAWERTSRATPAPAAIPADGSTDEPTDGGTPLSPFTAALMRMVTSDDEVQTAVATVAQDARLAEDEEERAAAELTRALARERADRAARAQELSDAAAAAAAEEEAVAAVAAARSAARERQQAAVLESERRAAARLRAEQEAQDAAEAVHAAAEEEAAQAAARRTAALRAEATARRTAAREAGVAELARVEFERAAAEAWEIHAQREKARVTAARAEAARREAERAARAEAAAAEAARVEQTRIEAAQAELARHEAELAEQDEQDEQDEADRRAAEHAAATERAEAARLVAAHETARFEAPALRAVPSRDPRRSAPPPPVDRAAARRAAALRAAGRQAERQAVELRADSAITGQVPGSRAERLRSVLAALPTALPVPDAVPADAAVPARVGGPQPAPQPAPPLAGWALAALADGHLLPEVATPPATGPMPAAAPSQPPPPPLHSSQSSPREEAHQVSTDQSLVPSSPVPDVDGGAPPRLELPAVPPRAGGRASRRAADRRAAELAALAEVAALAEQRAAEEQRIADEQRAAEEQRAAAALRAAEEQCAVEEQRAVEAHWAAVERAAASDLWGSPAPTPVPSPVVDPAGRHRPAGAVPPATEPTPIPEPTAAEPAATVPTAADEQLEALRLAALSGSGSTPRRRRADAAGRHRPAGTGLLPVVRADGPAEAEGTLVAVVAGVAVAEPLHTPDHASGFLEVIAAVADSDFLGDAPVRPDLAPEVSSLLVEEMAQEMAAGMADELARTASDPAPMPLPMSTDPTTVLPPLSSLLAAPAAVPRVRGPRPPVPPVRGVGRSRTAPPHPTSTRGRDASPVTAGLATVTQLVLAGAAAPAADPTSPGLVGLGLPATLLGADFPAEAAARGTFAALTTVLSRALPAAPSAPSEPGDVLVVVGPGAEALGAARVLATSLRLDPARVQWATRGELSGLSSPDVGVPTAAVAAARRAEAAEAGVPTVVAVDVPLRDAGSAWVAQMVQAWAPTAVWGVLDATRKPADLTGWLAALPRVDAVVVTETESSADPAALLAGLPVPVAVVDGARATAHRWAALLCERLAGRP